MISAIIFHRWFHRPCLLHISSNLIVFMLCKFLYTTVQVHAALLMISYLWGEFDSCCTAFPFIPIYIYISTIKEETGWFICVFCSILRLLITSLFLFIKLYYPSPRISVCVRNWSLQTTNHLVFNVSMVLPNLVNGVSERFFSTRWMKKHQQDAEGSFWEKG